MTLHNNITMIKIRKQFQYFREDLFLIRFYNRHNRIAIHNQKTKNASPYDCG